MNISMFSLTRALSVGFRIRIHSREISPSDSLQRDKSLFPPPKKKILYHSISYLFL